MNAAIITVGDELLAGDIDNTNASWLAARLSERGVLLKEIATIPDEEAKIGETVRRFSDEYDAVIVTGGVGGTPDDVTMEGVAAAFGVPLEVDDEAYEAVAATVEEIRDRYPDFDVDMAAEASVPAGATVLLNSEGLSPGCVIQNVFVLPGIPGEMKAMFEDVADRFDGNLYSRTTHTELPESNIVGLLEEIRDEFDVSVGCYPDPERGPKRIKITADDQTRLRSAYDALTAELGEDAITQ